MFCLLHSRKQSKTQVSNINFRSIIVKTFRHKHVVLSLNKGENWFAPLTNIAILKTQNYWREMIT